jgi:glycosyltransferase involved in cell wall biosynthesis
MQTPATSQDSRPPRFSVIVPAYNAQAYLTETILSVLAQTFPDFELVIVDDGSTDRTRKIAMDFASTDQRVTVLDQENAGCASASNTAIAAARGEFICILGADDRYRPAHLEQQAAFINAHPGYDIYSCNAANLWPDGSMTPYLDDVAHRRVVSFTLDDWLESCPINGLAIYRRDLAERLGGYRVTLRNAEDYDFWLRAISSGARHIHNPTTLTEYRRHDRNKSRDRVKAALALARILDDLADSAELAPQQRAHARRVAARRRAAVARRESEQRMLEGDFTRARRTFVATAGGYANKVKYALALLVVLVSPRLYARVALREEPRLASTARR